MNLFLIYLSLDDVNEKNFVLLVKCFLYILIKHLLNSLNIMFIKIALIKNLCLNVNCARKVYCHQFII